MSNLDRSKPNPYFNDHFFIHKGIKVFPRLNLYDYYERIGDSNSRVIRFSEHCIFCGEHLKKQKANFSHLIPDLFGKNRTQNPYECNDCNTLSGKWETSLGTLTIPLRVLGKIKNKKGKIPKFKSRLGDHKNQTKIFYDKNNVLQCKMGTIEDFIVDNATEKGQLKFRTGSYNPSHVYKAFLKIALSLMDNEVLESEKWMTKYLFHESKHDQIFPLLFVIYLDEKIVKESYFELLRYVGTHDNHPKYTLVAHFGKTIFQLFLPLNRLQKNLFVQLPKFMDLLSPRDNYPVELIDLESNSNEHRDWIFSTNSRTNSF